ncbi:MULTISPECIES: GNAT family N-acetyltransferase [Halomonadaceae]|jgi:ribosomal protein S18 acetylase RimI-like enzyme|uniref:GNAT family N-acetyltransferase n=1 Tax=Halomonadaceae TaxID=28256 RepID=UPI000A2835C4|nr:MULTISPECIES: GNAT family N-acetyltransferase [Halomonas]MDR5886404.1 GNAT family N-acetyltransferase [Halomonas janggokensis]QPL47030.1 GNAT family N-acetyltransferase [Halomonas sp. A40-4]
MEAIIRRTDDKAFAENIIRQNMSAYYKHLDMHWDPDLFDKNWDEFDSYALVVNACPVGLLCLNREAGAYYIRELQIDQKWQRQGLGTAAIRYAMAIAQQANVDLLRLRVFSINPATALYERMGFRILKTEGGTHYMERSIF